MTINLIMEPTFIVETMGLQWTSELTFAENVPVLIKQFKKERGLKPFKVRFIFIISYLIAFVTRSYAIDLKKTINNHR